MKEYYFLVSLLPTLEIGHIPQLGFSELKALLRINLGEEDQERVIRFLRMIDFENMRSLWSHEPHDPRGNLDREGLKQAIDQLQWSDNEEFEPFLIDYLEKYHTDQERLRHFSFLMGNFYNYEIANEKGFLFEFFNFQRELRLVLVGFRAKKLGKDVSSELQYEDPYDPLVAQIIAQKDSSTYEPPFEYKELKPIFEEYGSHPRDLHKAIYQYEFDHMVELGEKGHFTIEKILTYLARLLLVEKWLELDIQKGIQVIDTIEEEIQ